jgi:thiol:disulfide interchange protein
MSVLLPNFLSISVNSLIKNIFLLILFLIFSNQKITAQIQNKYATWQIKASKTEAKIGEEVEIIFTAEIDNDWYLYSSDFPDGGPTVTKFTFQPNASYTLVGKLQAINSIKKYDDAFEMDVKFFKKKGEFRQKIKILNEKFSLSGNIDYQTCSDKNGSCVPGDYDFSFKNIVIQKSENKEDIKNNSDSSTKNITKAKQKDSIKTLKDTISTSQKDNKTSLEIPENTSPQESQGLFAFAIFAFLGGLAALLTPCVYPMIPMTVSLFMKGDRPIAATATTEEKAIMTKRNRRAGIVKALVYGLSIVFIFTLLGVVASLIFGIEFNTELSSHWIPNLIFFAILIFFALSFLGMFEILLPNSLVNEIDKKADKGGYSGIFFMAFALVVVSFSCTAPIVGSIIFSAATDGAILKPIVGMVAFSMAFAIPFTFFALFPSAMKSLPKSGGWLNSVKVVLGFLELALAFKFLSSADLSYHWGLLDRDVFLAIWISIFGLLGLYLIGKLRLPHDSAMEKISVPRLMLAVAVFSFVIYLIPGLFGASLKPLAGIIPPQTTHNFDVPKLSQSNQNNSTSNSSQKIGQGGKKYASFLSLPHNLQGFYDYKEGLEYAKKVNKPIFLDFTGHNCANCRKMEEIVWINPSVYQHLKEDFVIISLYVDDKTELAESDWVTSKLDGKVKKTLGKVNLNFEAERFKTIAQPYYCILDTDDNLLINPPIGSEFDVKKFNTYLETGLKNFKNK